MSNDTQPKPPAGAANVNPPVDIQHGEIGTGGGYSGEEYDSHDHEVVRALNDSTTGGGARPAEASPDDDRDIPPDNGKRASIDYATGAVHGSGASAGGGNRGEDFEDNPVGGDGYPVDKAITGDDEPMPDR